MTLAGPAAFFRVVSEDLLEGNCVMAGLPVGFPSDLVRACVARAIRARSSATCDQLQNASPSSLVSQLVGRRASTRSSVYLDALACGESVADDWNTYVGPQGQARMLDKIQTRVCVVLLERLVVPDCVEKHFRQRRWHDYVTTLDSITLAFEQIRQVNQSEEYKELKVSLVGALCGPNLLAAERYSQYSLRQLVDVGEHPRDAIWSGQVSALFPLVNRERIKLLHRYPKFWRLNGSESLSDLELTEMVKQARGHINRRDWKRIHWLKGVRDRLAHMDCIPWAVLEASPVFEFCRTRDADYVR